MSFRRNSAKWETSREIRSPTWTHLVCSSSPPGKTSRTWTRWSKCFTGGLVKPEEQLRSECVFQLNPLYAVFRLIQYPAAPSKGRITVTKEDLACLGGGEFLNDVIIDFYLKSVWEQQDAEIICTSSKTSIIRKHQHVVFWGSRTPRKLDFCHFREKTLLRYAEDLLLILIKPLGQFTECNKSVRGFWVKACTITCFNHYV